jgi:hypothetical protein
MKKVAPLVACTLLGPKLQNYTDIFSGLESTKPPSLIPKGQVSSFKTLEVRWALKAANLINGSKFWSEQSECAALKLQAET